MNNSGAARGSHARTAAMVILMAALGSEVSHADVGKDRFKGTCQQLNDFIQRAGVTDAKSQNHPKAAGWTTFEIRPSPYSLTYRTEMKDRQVCVEGVLAENPTMFSATYQVTRMDWEPLRSVSEVCLAERARWEKATEDRERQQVDQIDGIVDRHNKAWSAVPHVYRACAASESPARTSAGQQAEKDIKLEVGKIEAEVLNAVDTDRAAGGKGIAFLDCSPCDR